MTKVSVFGQQATESKKLKPIEFVKRLHSEGAIYPSITSPKKWDNVMLFKKSIQEDYFDVILAFHDNGQKAVFLGHWNDGVV